MNSTSAAWQRYQQNLYVNAQLGLEVDWSRMSFDRGKLQELSQVFDRALQSMTDLEAGAIANPDEDRRVGHYWLRAPNLAPNPEISAAITNALVQVKQFAKEVHEGVVRPQNAPRFTHFLLIGIGGSALGPQLVADALAQPRQDRLTPLFLDNTDPDGMHRTLQLLGDALGRTLVIVISKSGGTPETRNGMLVAARTFAKRNLNFAQHAVAITGEGSKLDKVAHSEGWLARFPMWEWVGGRTSVTSAVGLLPAALQGVDIDAFLEGARLCDASTRNSDMLNNPAALLAASWYLATEGRGAKDMVVLPYSDRLLLFARYLQQLIMESLGKEKDLDGKVVRQGLTVYGNKGSTDQHAYVQQLREGVPNFFTTFVDVREHPHDEVEVEPGITAGDYLRGFLLGTRQALYEAGRPSLTLSIQRVDAKSMGVLIALFERAVGFYANFININAYHQPGVEAGKKAATRILDLQKQALAVLAQSAAALTADDIAQRCQASGEAENIFHVLHGLAANNRHVIQEGQAPGQARFIDKKSAGVGA